MMNKTECPITRAEFSEHARAMTAQLGTNALSLNVKEFKPQKGKSAGSLGWFDSGKAVVTVNGTPVKVQYQIQAVVIGSADAE